MNTTELDLVLRSFDHELTDAELEALALLLDADQEALKFKTEEEAIRSLIAGTRADSFGPDFPARVLAKSHGDSGTFKLRAVPRSLRISRSLVAAASLVLLVVAGWLLATNRPDSSFVSISVANATTETVTLPDGSSVTLNAGSSMVYPRDFNADRTVRLNGEAFFNVEHDGSPFIVTTQDASVTVLGTSFNVRAWSTIESRTIVTLESGSLKIEDLAKQSVVLTPGERIVIKSSLLAEQDSAGVAARTGTAIWRRGVVAFDREPFAFAMAELERLYDLQITFNDSALAARNVTYLPGNREPIDTVLSTICNAFSVRYRATANGFEILTGP